MADPPRVYVVHFNPRDGHKIAAIGMLAISPILTMYAYGQLNDLGQPFVSLFHDAKPFAFWDELQEKMAYLVPGGVTDHVDETIMKYAEQLARAVAKEL